MTHIIYPAIVILLTLIITSCSREPAPEEFLHSKTLSVVSLSPSISRQIIDLDAEDMISGVTTYHEFMKKRAAVVGSIVNPNLEIILRLKPDYVLMSEEDSQVQRADMILKSGLKVVTFASNRDFKTITENYMKLASLLGREETGLQRTVHYEGLLTKYASTSNKSGGVIFFVSLDPLIPVSGRSYIGDIIRMSGAENLFEDLKRPYPVVSSEEIYKKDPLIIVVALDNPDREFFNKKFPALSCVKNGRVFFLDTDPFAYYSPSDFVRSVKILSSLLNSL